jgi:prolyl oligopeptidase PreP (S9A serine peptidase family)
LEEFGQSFLFFESERGGHGFANPRQRAEETAMRWIYFYMRLVEKKDI